MATISTSNEQARQSHGFDIQIEEHLATTSIRNTAPVRTSRHGHCIFCIIAFVYLFMSTLATAARSYHVEVTGSDTSGDGSAAAPWRSIGKAAQQALEAGDVVWVGPGTYPNDSITFRHSGAAVVELTTGVEIVGANQLRFPSGTDLSALDFAAHAGQYYLYVYRSWQSNNGAFLVIAVWEDAEGLLVEVAGADWRVESGEAGNAARLSACVARPIVFRNRSSACEAERVVVDASGSAVYSLWFIGNYVRANDIRPADFLLFDGFDLTGMNGVGIHLRNSSFTVLMDLRISNGGAPGALLEGDSTHPAIYNMLYRSRIWNTPAEGIYLGAGDQGMARNHLHFTHVIDCEVFTVGTGAAAQLENAIDLKEFNNGHTVERNHIRDLRLISSYNGAIHLSPNTRDALIYNNRVSEITYAGDRPVAAFTIETQGAANVAVFNNVISQAEPIADQTYAFHIKGHSTAENILIAHNTVSGLHRALFLEYYDTAGPYDITVANNIFAVTDTAANLIYLGGGVERGLLTHQLWTTAPTRFSSEPERMVGAAGFVDPLAGDFRLLPGSIAIDSATVLDARTAFDAARLARPLDGNGDGTAVPDRGAFELPNPLDADLEPPSIPAGMRVMGRTSDRIHLAWSAATDNAQVSHYLLERDGLLLGSMASTRFTDSWLSPDTLYAYRVRAVDLAGNQSGLSEPLEVATHPRPTAFTLLYDFGHTDFPTGGNWNNIASANPNDLTGVVLSQSVDTMGRVHPVTVAIDDDFFGVTTGGMNVIGRYPASATRDGWWLGFHGGFGEPDTLGRAVLAGLEPGAQVDLIFFGSRADATYDRWTRFKVDDQEVHLNTLNNSNQVAVLQGLTVGPAGSLAFEVTPLIASGFAYLNVLEVVVSPGQSNQLSLQGTPYHWLHAHFGDQELFFEFLDVEDVDRDGFATWKEFAFLTDPNDPAEFPVGPRWLVDADPPILFLPVTHPGRTYRIDTSPNLEPGSWLPFATHSGDGNAWSLPFPLPESGPRFYRLEVSVEVK